MTVLRAPSRDLGHLPYCRRAHSFAITPFSLFLDFGPGSYYLPFFGPFRHDGPDP
jgi:hypothetical protein